MLKPKITWLALGKTGLGHAGIWALAFWNAALRLKKDIDLQVFVQQDFAAKVLGPHLPKIILLNPGQENLLSDFLNRNPPDILVSEMHWFAVQPVLETLKACGTQAVYLARQVHKDFFHPTQLQPRHWFQPDRWDLCFGLEMWEAPQGFAFLNPMIMKEPQEILPAAKAKALLGTKTAQPTCVLAETGNPDDRLRVWDLEERYRHLGYETIVMGPGRFWHFPLIDLFNGIDFLVTGAGYNTFWESRYYHKQSHFLVCPRQFEDQKERVRKFADASVPKNGAEELVDILIG